MNRKAEKRRTLDLKQARKLKRATAARLAGKWDDPALVAIGPLSDTGSDVRYIAKFYGDPLREIVAGYALRRAARGG